MAATALEAQKQRYQGVQKESAGYKLMAAMGWKEGEGLGASKQGIKEHIRVKKNYENWGVGAITAADRAKEWTAGMADFHRVLSTLSEITSQHAGKKPEEEDSEDEAAATTTDEESDASDGELKKKKKKDNSSKNKILSKTEKKKRKKEEKKALKQKKNKKSTSTSSSSSGDDEKEDAAPAKRVKLATHLGRFKKRESAKMVANYSSHDLAAILGEDPFAAAAAAVTAAAGQQSSGGYESDSESDSEANEDGDKITKRQKKSATKTTKVITIQEHQEAQEAAADKNAKQEESEKDEDLSEYWWSSYFVRRGKMGSLRRTAPNRARGFSEQDQTDLYTKAQDGATQGRVGLGRASMPKKVAGTRWIGKKKKLGSDSENESGSEGEEERRHAKEADALEKKEAEEEEKRGVVVVLPGGGGALEKVKNEAAVPVVAGTKKIKWKKVVTDVLSRERSDTSMKLKAVVKAVMEVEGLGKSRKIEASEAIASVVEGSSKFKLDGKNVRLA
jgi:Pin2-interacting protein X1